MLTVIPIQDRHRHLAEERKHARSSEYVFYDGQYQPFPVIRLPLNVPLYRVDNGRLSVLKTEYIRMRNKTPDFFAAGDESPEVQAVLHDMLLQLARDPDASIYNELRVTALQTVTLLITGDGIVLDGNRRLASMRTLYGADPERYAGFNQLDAVVLPETATDTQLEMIEATRQMAPDLKLAYGWIERRLKLRYHRDSLKLPVESICRAYRLTSGHQLHEEIDQLALAEDYLENYLQQPLNYKSIEDKEQFFSALHQQLAKIPDGSRRRTWQLVGYAVIKEAKNLEIEIEQQFPFAPARPPYAPVPVLELYGGENNLWPYSADLGTGAFLRSVHYKTLIEELDRPAVSGTIAKEFIRLFNRMLAEHEDNPHPIAIINRLRQINRMLTRVKLPNFTESQRSELFGQLAELSYQFRYLTRREGEKSDSPVVITGFTPFIHRPLRLLVRGCSWIKRLFRKSQ